MRVQAWQFCRKHSTHHGRKYNSCVIDEPLKEKEERQAEGAGSSSRKAGIATQFSQPPAPKFDKALALFSIALTGQQGKLDKMDFQTRRMFQQTVFLLQKLGTDLGYDFKLTVVGVYSKKLGEDMRERYGEPK